MQQVTPNSRVGPAPTHTATAPAAATCLQAFQAQRAAQLAALLLLLGSQEKGLKHYKSTQADSRQDQLCMWPKRTARADPAAAHCHTHTAHAPRLHAAGMAQPAAGGAVGEICRLALVPPLLASHRLAAGFARLGMDRGEGGNGWVQDASLHKAILECPA